MNNLIKGNPYNNNIYNNYINNNNKQICLYSNNNKQIGVYMDNKKICKYMDSLNSNNTFKYLFSANILNNRNIF